MTTILTYHLLLDLIQSRRIARVYVTKIMDPNSIMKNDSEFKRLNSMCSRSSYVSDKLRENDYNGFSSAGILVIDDGYDLISEVRDDSTALSIPGGKRDYIAEDPYTTAIREYREESGKVPPNRRDMNQVMWYGRGKYALFIINKRDGDLPPIPSSIHPFSMTLIETYSFLSKRPIQ